MTAGSQRTEQAGWEAQGWGDEVPSTQTENGRCRGWVSQAPLGAQLRPRVVRRWERAVVLQQRWGAARGGGHAGATGSHAKRQHFLAAQEPCTDPSLQNGHHCSWGPCSTSPHPACLQMAARRILIRAS